MKNTIGSRLKFIRSLTKLSRIEVQNQADISTASLAKWENDAMKISDKNIRRCVVTYRKLGMIISEEWLKNGGGDKPKLTESEKSYVQLLATKSPTFLSYIDQNERFLFINKNYEELLKLPADEIIGKTLLEICGERGYRVCKPHINKVLAGEHCYYSYPWEQSEGNFLYLNIEYIPDIIEKSKQVKGFYSFIDERTKFKNIHDNHLKAIDINDFLPRISKINDVYNHKLFKESHELTYKLFSLYKITYSIECILKVASNVYKFSSRDQELNKEYAESIILAAIQAGYLSCND